MGCAQSRIENEEAVARCKERRQWMKAAVAARNAFAAAHSAYAFSLRDTGAALSEFAHGEGVPTQTPPGEAEEAAPGAAAQGGAGAGAAVGGAGASAAGAEPIMPPPPPLDSLPPPPPPLPEFSPSPAKIHRSISMPLPPSAAAKVPSMLHSDSIREEDEGDVEREEEEEDDGRLENRRRRLRHQPPVPPPVSPPPPETPMTPQPPPPPPPEPKSGIDTWDYFFSMDQGMASIGPDDDEIIAEPEEEKYVPPSPPRPPPSPPPPAPVPLSEEFEEEPRTPEMVTPPPSSLPPKPPKHSSKKKKGKGKMKAAHHQHTESAPPITLVGNGKTGKVAPEMPRVDLLRVLADIDERFLNASQSAGEVSKVLEANRMHYHSNFVDNRGQLFDCALIHAILSITEVSSGRDLS